MPQPQPVPDIPVDIMNQIAAADGWCLATGHLVEKKGGLLLLFAASVLGTGGFLILFLVQSGAKPTKLPDFKLKVDDGQLQGYCCTEVTNPAHNAAGNLSGSGRSRIAACVQLAED